MIEVIEVVFDHDVVRLAVIELLVLVRQEIGRVVGAASVVMRPRCVESASFGSCSVPITWARYQSRIATASLGSRLPEIEPPRTTLS